MKKTIFWLAALAVFAVPFIGMYFYASTSCVPADHTYGFCSRWIVMGMIHPVLWWLLVAVAVMLTLAVRR